jgi:quinol-cytochrome oxidoreductase complex cytochrome b subunit
VAATAPRVETPGEKVPSRFYRWFNERTGICNIMRASFDEPIPGGARLAYIFGSGLLFIFISQVITGQCLALYYVPSVESAHTSVAYIAKQVAAGQFLRSLHYYGANAMIIVLLCIFCRRSFMDHSKAGASYCGWRATSTMGFGARGLQR